MSKINEKSAARVDPPPGAAAAARRLDGWWPFAFFLPYLAALAWWRDIVPDGLNNDVAEEVLRGLHLIEERKFEVMTLAIGNSAETLYLYVVGAVAKLLGPSTLAAELPSWAAALAVIWLLERAARRMDAALPPWAPLLLGVSSVWLFHYARSGLRAIAAPVFLLSFWLLLDRAERPGGTRRAAFACGAVLGLSLYAYTSCRVLPVIFLLYAAFRLLRSPAERARLSRCYGLITLGAFVLSLPNLWFFLNAPGEFLFRGSYVVRGGAGDMVANAFWSLLLPFSVYADSYRNLQGPAHFFDGVSAALTMAGINPIHPLIAVAFLAGLARIWKMRREPAAAFIVIAWLTATVLLGITGPSLTRMLIVLPVYLAVACLGVAEGMKRLPAARWVFALALLGVVAAHGYAYFTRLPASPVSSYYFGPAATPIGERAAELASQGRRVLCVITKDANVVRYLTHEHAGRVHIAEFYFRPLIVEEIPLKDFNPAVLLIENNDRFAGFASLLPPPRPAPTGARFVEIDLQSAR
jgi:hypothetical protein